MRREPAGLERYPSPRMSATTSAKSCSTKYGIKNRSCSSVPHRTSRAGAYGLRQNRATIARSNSCCVRLMRACGGISNARISNRPNRPAGPSGEYILSMQNSARWVLPVTSISRLRIKRSTSQGGTYSPGFGNRLKAISNSYRASFLASSTRGACEVGPMNNPENR